MKPVSDNDTHSVYTAEHHIEEEKDEEFLVLDAYAAVDPRAVVVHSGNASSTSRAVMCFWGLWGLTLLTVTPKDFVHRGLVFNAQLRG